MIGSIEFVLAILEWVLLELARHSQILQKLQKELDIIVSEDKCFNGKNVINVPYLQVLNIFLVFLDVYFFVLKC
jgi:cytochrome P450